MDLIGELVGSGAAGEEPIIGSKLVQCPFSLHINTLYDIHPSMSMPMAVFSPSYLGTGQEYLQAMTDIWMMTYRLRTGNFNPVSMQILVEAQLQIVLSDTGCK